MILFLNFIIMDIKLLIVGLYFQALNFGIVTLVCIYLYLRLKNPQKEAYYKKYIYLIYSALCILCLIFTILTVFDVL